MHISNDEDVTHLVIYPSKYTFEFPQVSKAFARSLFVDGGNLIMTWTLWSD